LFCAPVRRCGSFVIDAPYSSAINFINQTLFEYIYSK